jgi:hypothetical protein
MIVVPIDDRDVGRNARKRARREQAAEARADDDDFRSSHSLTSFSRTPLQRRILVSNAPIARE